MTKKQKQLLADALLALDDTVVVVAERGVSRDGYRLTEAQFRDLVKARDLLFEAGVRVEVPA
jgi:hypothetical protein